jgi:hypothetical protein
VEGFLTTNGLSQPIYSNVWERDVVVVVGLPVQVTGKGRSVHAAGSKLKAFAAPGECPCPPLAVSLDFGANETNAFAATSIDLEVFQSISLRRLFRMTQFAKDYGLKQQSDYIKKIAARDSNSGERRLTHIQDNVHSPSWVLVSHLLSL